MMSKASLAQSSTAVTRLQFLMLMMMEHGVIRPVPGGAVGVEPEQPFGLVRCGWRTRGFVCQNVREAASGCRVLGVVQDLGDGGGDLTRCGPLLQPHSGTEAEHADGVVVLVPTHRDAYKWNAGRQGLQDGAVTGVGDDG